MAFFNQNTNLLKKMEESIELSQKTNENLTLLLEQLFTPSHQETQMVSEEEKFRAAYALNLCTISVSQIIDYNDLRTLENEYEAILNNLNLENMPKDEALLHILKQLLDVITFFRIQEGDKKMLEREYQNKVKNAIWNAIPSSGLFVAGATPTSIAISLASQIGIGYMNYRKEKAHISMEEEKSKWEMQRSAMEQFNGLRKELFDTAWRLADKYEFKDEYRITERQISQFNTILLDDNDLRRYERLKYVESSFQAYPPFYYYLGSAASAVSRGEGYTEEFKNEFKSIAIGAYDFFLNKTNSNILREDQLEASCALELFELYNDQSHLNLLERAIKASNHAFDVIQICAISYLKCNKIDEAVILLRMLVNEKYNLDINAKLLSKLYVYKLIEGDKNVINRYHELQNRCEDILLFPLPDGVDNIEMLEHRFKTEMIIDLKFKFADALEYFFEKYEEKYNRILSQNHAISLEIVSLFNEIVNKLNCLDEEAACSFSNKLSATLYELNDQNKMTVMLESNNGGRNRENSLPFGKIMSAPLEAFVDKICGKLKMITSCNIASSIELRIDEFISNNNLDLTYSELVDKNKLDDFGLLNKERYEKTEKCMNILKKDKYCKDKLIKKDKNLEFLLKDEYDFNRYFNRNNKLVKIIKEPIAILNDTSPKDEDLIFTTTGIYVVNSIFYLTKIPLELVPYNQVREGKKNDVILLKQHEFKNKMVDGNLLLDLCKELSNVIQKSPVSDWKQALLNKFSSFEF